MKDESAVQRDIRLALAVRGWTLWRNNVGAGKLENGNFIRWGLCNDSKDLNSAFKSGDLIGIYPRLILPSDVGHHIGQFASIECKPEGWEYKGTDREKAQLAWRDLVLRNGGVAQFATSPTDIDIY